MIPGRQIATILVGSLFQTSAFHPVIRRPASTKLHATVEKVPGCNVPPLPALKNSYFALRHGESTANIAGIISSLPAVGTTTHGLSDKGKEQARGSAVDLLRACGGQDAAEKLFWVSSDFTRAKETAEESLSALYDSLGLTSLPVVEVEEALRERWFGELDGKSVATYNDVWPLDLEDATHTSFGVESVESVCTRVRDMFVRLEDKYQSPDGGPCSIVLTSHADTLQIMQCFVAKHDVRFFSQYRFQNGEVRELGESPESLPPPVPLERDKTRM